MTQLFERPLADEYAQFYAGYVAAVPMGVDPRAVLRDQERDFPAVLAPVTGERSLYRYAPGKWSIREVVGHVADAERVFAYRLLRIARGDATPLPGFDEDEYVRAAEFDRRAWPALIEDWAAVRAATLTLVDGLADDAWSRRAVVNGRMVSARALPFIVAGHLQHHAGILRDRYGIGSLDPAGPRG